jgi:SAM-dependent methyltransferase
MTFPGLHILALALLEGDLRQVRERIRRWLRPEARTLDVACGPGLFADLFAAGDYVGIDPRPRFVDYARRRRPGAFLCEEPSAVDLPAGRFDQALAFDALGRRGEAEARALLTALRRVLVPGGAALVLERAEAGDRVARLAAALGRVERTEPFASGRRRRVAVLLRAGS